MTFAVSSEEEEMAQAPAAAAEGRLAVLKAYAAGTCTDLCMGPISVRP